MTKDANQEGLIVGVAGAGAMGRGIAQVAATGGCTVRLYDAKEGAAAGAKTFIADMLGRNVEKGRMAKEDADAAVDRIEVIDALAGFKGADCVIEAVVENLAVKHAVFK
jgi:3-hydroxybutyryl-CoA dehydrogenase